MALIKVGVSNMGERGWVIQQVKINTILFDLSSYPPALFWGSASFVIPYIRWYISKTYCNFFQEYLDKAKKSCRNSRDFFYIHLSVGSSWILVIWK